MKNRWTNRISPVLCVLYLFGLIGWIAYAWIFTGNYFYIYPVINSAQAFFFQTLMNLGVPLIFLLVGFFLTKKEKVMAGILCFILVIPLSVCFFIRGAGEILYYPTVGSYTDDLDDFGVFDETLAERLALNPVPNFPEHIPDDVIDVRYRYYYQYASSERVRIVVTWRYEQIADYQNAIASLKGKRVVSGNLILFTETYYTNAVLLNDETQQIAFVILDYHETEIPDSIDELLALAEAF